MNIREDVALAPLTTMGVGGAARYFVEAASADEMREAVAWARQRELPCFVLGAGSNLVVADAGFAGLVLKPVLRGCRSSDDGARARLTVAAGEDWDAVVEYAVGHGYAGLECLSGIPGSAGATPVQNVGAYGQEVAETIIEVEALDVATGEVCRFTNEACEFTYRGSRFNGADAGMFVILGVTFELAAGAAPQVEYADLKRHFAGRQPTLGEVRAAVIEIRRSKGMLTDRGSQVGSAGSFFKNHVLSSAAYRELAERVAGMGLELPAYPALASQHKVPAAWLIENAGFARGYRCGRVGTSPYHALALVNLGGATAAEVVGLQREIQRAVRARFGVELRAEPVMLGL